MWPNDMECLAWGSSSRSRWINNSCDKMWKGSAFSIHLPRCMMLWCTMSGTVTLRSWQRHLCKRSFQDNLNIDCGKQLQFEPLSSHVFSTLSKPHKRKDTHTHTSGPSQSIRINPNQSLSPCLPKAESIQATRLKSKAMIVSCLADSAEGRGRQTFSFCHQPWSQVQPMFGV